VPRRPPHAWLALIASATLVASCRSGDQRGGRDLAADAPADRLFEQRLDSASPDRQQAVDLRSGERPPTDRAYLEALPSLAGWAVSAGGDAATISVVRIALDAAGNVYVAGALKDTATFGTQVIGTKGVDSGFMAKLDAAGTFLWAKAIVKGGSLTGMAVDAAGNSTIAGGFSSSVTIGSTTLTAPQSAVFVARLDAQGNVPWAVEATFDGPPSPGGSISAGPVAVDASGNAYVGGSLLGPATFGSHKLTDTDAVFVAKLGSVGDFLWVVQTKVTTGMLSGNWLRAMAVAPSGQIVVAGSFSNAATLSCPAACSGSYSPGGAFAVGVDAGGTSLWTSTACCDCGWAFGHDLAVDGSGNSFFAVELAPLTTAVPAVAHCNVGGHALGSFTAGASVVAKLDPGGQVQWTSLSSGTYGWLGSYGVGVDGPGNVYSSGTYRTWAFGPWTLPTPNGKAVFVARYDPTGAFITATTSGSSAVSRRLAVDPQGNVLLAGELTWPTLFGSTVLTPHGPLDGAVHDLFVWKLKFP
jgi:hypothetical protein